MLRIFDLTGSLLGLAGAVAVIVAILVRLTGQFFLLGVELRAWLLGGIALMVMACLFKLHVLVRQAYSQEGSG